jgi:hypothetical protein
MLFIFKIALHHTSRPHLFGPIILHILYVQVAASSPIHIIIYIRLSAIVIGNEEVKDKKRAQSSNLGMARFTLRNPQKSDYSSARLVSNERQVD